MQVITTSPPTMLPSETQRPIEIISAATSLSVTMTPVHDVTRTTTAQRQHQQQWRLPSMMPSSEPLTADITPIAAASSVTVPTVRLATVVETTTTHAPGAIILTNFVAMVTLITAVLSIAAIVLVVWTIRRYVLDDWQRVPTEGRSTFGSVVSETDLLDQVARIYWRDVQPALDDTLRFIDVARRTTIFRSVTAFDLFAYKFRTYSDVDSSLTGRSATVGDGEVDRCFCSGRDPYTTLRNVKHLFELLTLCLPPSTCLDTNYDQDHAGLRRRLSARIVSIVHQYLLLQIYLKSYEKVDEDNLFRCFLSI